MPSEARKRRRVSEDVGGAPESSSASIRMQRSPDLSTSDVPRTLAGQNDANPIIAQGAPSQAAPGLPTVARLHDGVERNDFYRDSTPALEAYFSIPLSDDEQTHTPRRPHPQSQSTPRAGRSLIDRNPWAILENQHVSPPP